MKNDKAAGFGGIPIEVVKHESDILLEKLMKVYNKYLLIVVTFQMIGRY